MEENKKVLARIVNLYMDGFQISYIGDELGLTEDEVLKILRDYKDRSRYKKTFTDEFKIMIAERDRTDVTRNSIAKELNINANTVKKACEQFGDANKEKASSMEEYTRINTDFELNPNKPKCPVCHKEHKVNIVDLNTTYCLNCGSECIHHVETNEDDEVVNTYAEKIEWAYLEE